MKNTTSQAKKGKLDRNQERLHEHFPQGHYLSNQLRVERVIDWITFYRRNINLFASHYAGIPLHLYQHLVLWALGKYLTIAIIAARATAKSWIISLFAVCYAMLYPGSLIVLASATRGQSEIIIKEKIQQDLMRRSATISAAIKKVVANQSDTEILFHNGSKIFVVTANQNARGHRSNLIIYEEFRQMDKKTIDSVLAPFQIARHAPFMDSPDYADLPPEEPKDIYISSAWYRSHWMWGSIRKWVESFIGGGTCMLIALDYAVSLAHGIKTKRLIAKDKREFDDITFRIEYENEMIAENTDAYFNYSLLHENQKLKRAWYPRTTEDVVLRKKNPYDISKQAGEIRIISCDMAFVNREGNDNSCFSCLRLLPESIAVQGPNGTRSVRSAYRCQVVYLEAFPGCDTTAQARRIKQLDADFNADYIVLDTRNGGIAVYDMLSKVLFDEERGVEYAPWRCMNDDNVASRTIIEGAEQKLFSVSASVRLNSDIAINMRQALSDGRVDLLIHPDDAMGDILLSYPQYVSAIDAETQLWYERPYRETQALVNETIELQYEKMVQTGAIRIFEQNGKNKDRYISVAYGLYFAQQLALDVLDDGADDYSEYAGRCVSSVTL